MVITPTVSEEGCISFVAKAVQFSGHALGHCLVAWTLPAGDPVTRSINGGTSPLGMVVALGRGMHGLGIQMGGQSLERTPDALGPEEELVLLLRFGRTPGRSRGEVALLIGRSLSAVGRIERRALHKLRRIALGPISHGWAGWDEV